MILRSQFDGTAHGVGRSKAILWRNRSEIETAEKLNCLQVCGRQGLLT